MKVLTFGWEYPPMKNGGLGVACMGLNRELSALGIEVLFVLPHEQEVIGDMRVIFGDRYPVRGFTIRKVESVWFSSYQSSSTRMYGYGPDGRPRFYSRSLLEEVMRYAEVAALIAKEEDFDVIHAHDWTSYLAGISAREATGKPCVLHVHATSFDQAGGPNVDPEIFAIESRAFEEADHIITVSHFTKRLIVEKHGVDPRKVEVVHNGIESIEPARLAPALAELKAAGKRIVLFHGRLTLQKGPDYFVRAARRVVDIDPNVIFIISGKGDMEHQVMNLVGELGLSANVKFVGALWDDDRDRMYQSADLFVMPSVSEPFGIVALEALSHGTPVLISKQSGVSEVLAHVLRADFWDTDEMANKILAALKYPTLHRQLATYGKDESRTLTWNRAAQKVAALFHKLREWYRIRFARTHDDDSTHT
jgi:glycosyltransferase involved in cell wall biosynthesis